MRLAYDLTRMAEGGIKLFWQERTSGVTAPAGANHNVITYSAADIMARLLGGDTTYRPTYIGFIYALHGKAFVNPGVDRLQPWDDIASEVETQGGNMLLCPLSASALYDLAGDTSLYSTNKVVLSARTALTSPLVFSGGGFTAIAPQPGVDDYYQIVLLARRYATGSTTPTYVPFARAGLTSGTTGIPVEANKDLVAYWDIRFK